MLWCWLLDEGDRTDIVKVGGWVQQLTPYLKQPLVSLSDKTKNTQLLK